MGITTIFVQFIIPLIIIMYCYGHIIWVLSARINRNDLGGNSDNRVTNSFEIARKNTLITLIIVACCYVICWIQNQVWFFMQQLGVDSDWNSPYYHFTVLMVFLNCTINPFVYLARYQDYQKALKDFVNCGKGGLQENQFQGSVASVTNHTSVTS